LKNNYVFSPTLQSDRTTLIADYYTGQKRANFMGLQGAFMGLGGVGFLSVGGFIADLNWRFPFLIYLSAWAICGAIALLGYLIIGIAGNYNLVWLGLKLPSLWV